MAHFTLEQVLMATRGQLLVRGPWPAFRGVCTDTRALKEGELFVALHGERFNGHDFLEQAQRLGAAGVLVEDSVPGVRRRTTSYGDWTIIEVTDTLYALGQLAHFHRRRFRVPVIGITGSAGKTTTKEMTAAIFEQRWPVLKTQGNFNNEIGLPLTLFTMTEEHRAAVLEFGMRGRGQIGYLAAIARPTIGVITNIGLTHLELLGSQEEIALAKAELLDEMPAGTTAILPRGDAFFSRLREHARGPVFTVGAEAGCDFWVSGITLGEDGGARFTLHTPETACPVRLGAPGRHQVWNALAAAAAALVAGATLDAVRHGLAAYRASKGRMQVHRAPGGYTVIDDSYNANPAAVRATLDFLAELPGTPKIAILGDMRELGSTAAELHRDLGAHAMALGVDALLAIGDLGREYVAGAHDPRAQWYPDTAATTEAARSLLTPGAAVLVKGSRAMGMEQIVAALLETS